MLVNAPVFMTNAIVRLEKSLPTELAGHHHADVWLPGWTTE
jgi:hypothetical protein